MPYKCLLAGLGGGLVCEAVALPMVFSHGYSMSLMLSYLALHALASVLLAFAICCMMPLHYRHPRAWLLMYLSAFNFFMPVLGLLCALAAMAVAVWWPKSALGEQFETTTAPLFTTIRKREGSGFKGNRVRAQLNNLGTPVDVRMNALVAIQHAPTHSSGDSLRQLLADPADDVRLLAYGILDHKEKKITQKILETRQQLDLSPQGQQRAVLHKQIAELYQELIYQNLVQGDLLLYSCDQMREHAQLALLLNPGDSGLWFMLVRLELMSNNAHGAELALLHAQGHGFARERLLPYLAQLSFLQKNYDQVRALFIEISVNPSASTTPQLYRYWMTPTASEQAYE